VVASWKEYVITKGYGMCSYFVLVLVWHMNNSDDKSVRRHKAWEELRIGDIFTNRLAIKKRRSGDITGNLSHSRTIIKVDLAGAESKGYRTRA
jgi:hypothetical protein